MTARNNGSARRRTTRFSDGLSDSELDAYLREAVSVLTSADMYSLASAVQAARLRLALRRRGRR
jgi:hypothetical protein